MGDLGVQGVRLTVRCSLSCVGGPWAEDSMGFGHRLRV